MRSGNNACRRPGIAATKGGKTRIVEWETRQPHDKGRGQHEAFRDHARRRPNASVDVKVC